MTKGQVSQEEGVNGKYETDSVNHVSPLVLQPFDDARQSCQAPTPGSQPRTALIDRPMPRP